MSVQESALYGDLVLWLRDRAAELLAEAGEDSTVEAETARLDELIRSWFFTPQDELHGCAPRDLIWAEQMDKPNPIPTDRPDEFFFDDCPICQQTKAEVEAAELEGMSTAGNGTTMMAAIPSSPTTIPKGGMLAGPRKRRTSRSGRLNRNSSVRLHQPRPTPRHQWKASR